MNRRSFLFTTALATGAALVAGALPLSVRAADDKPAKLRIGYQKGGIFLVVKARQSIEKALADQGIGVEWVEFAFGPPLLEALQAGAIDYGYTGDAPPIFAQAARADLLYVGAIPARGDGQAIVVAPDSPIQSVADLKGKKVAVAKGSSAHNLLVSATEAAGLKWGDFEVAYLAPADAAAAFARGSVDAWSIWDPYYALAELSPKGARPLPVDKSVAAQNSFFLANRTFTGKYPALVALVNTQIGDAVAWANTHRDEVAALYSEASGVPLKAQQRAVARAEFSFGPLTESVLAQQQGVADRFHKIGLIPKAIAVRDIVWTGQPA
ncbi:aliphatic sulfonate ABC transporter substrate-binding protein [Segnochrobactraceae bacterium EtOH-i3]